MFPNRVLNFFSLNPTKAGYLIAEELSPYFRSIFLKEVQGEYFAPQYDETTNNTGFKVLQTAIKLFSSCQKKIISRHLESFYLDHATDE